MNLDAVFRPRSVAVVGASARPDSLGRALYRNLRDAGFEGVLYPVNPSRRYIDTVPTVPDLAALPEPVDTAIVLVPAPAVAAAVRRGTEAGKVRSVVVLSGGFKEAGPAGAALEAELTAVVRAAGIPMIGPNCVGVINPDPAVRLMGVFAERPLPAAGNVAFVSQSGALCLSILDDARARGIGFSKFVSIGNKADVGELELLEYLADDPQTDVILMYVEELRDGRAFIETARRITVERKKPVFALKSGRSLLGARAAKSHTGSLSGSDAAYEAVLRQAGVERVGTMAELFDYAALVSARPLVAGPRVAVVTNAGGPGIIAVDAVAASGLTLAEFSPETGAAIRAAIPPHASAANPVDMTGDADEAMYERVLRAALADPNVDAALVILTPIRPGASEETARAVARATAGTTKTVACCFLGVSDFSAGLAVLHGAGLPHFPYPENAARALARSARVRAVQAIDPAKRVRPAFDVPRAAVSATIAAALADRTEAYLPQHAANPIFAAYGLTTLPGGFAADADAARALAARLTPPYVMKVMSPDVVHKAKAGGVVLGLWSPDDAAAAFARIRDRVTERVPGARIDGVYMEETAKDGLELIVGGSRDPRFGPMVMFGLGGRLVEGLRDVTFRLAPMWRSSAERMIDEIRGRALLDGVAGGPALDRAAAADAVLRVSELMADHPEIVEFDINPLVLHPRGATVADSRITLRRRDGA